MCGSEHSNNQFVDKSNQLSSAKMVSSESKAGMVIAGRGGRACDMCGKERARWYCAADEAYLCERCDGSVHSANAVARRHERVKLEPNGAPMKLKSSHKIKFSQPHETNVPSNPLVQLQQSDIRKWCSSARKRPRTPRKSSNPSGQSATPTSVKEEDSDALLLYDFLTPNDQIVDLSVAAPFDVKTEPLSPSSTLTSKDLLDLKTEETDFTQEVPTYEPLILQDLITSSHENLMEKLMPSSPSLCNVSCTSGVSTTSNLERTAHQAYSCLDRECSENETAVVNVENEQLRLYDLVESSTADFNGSISINEDSDIDTFDVMDLCSSATFDDNMKMEDLQVEFPDLEMWKAAYRSEQGAGNGGFEGNPFKGKGERDLGMGCINAECLQNETTPVGDWPQQQVNRKPLSLRLDYEDVITAWSDRGSLWMDGQRPQTVPNVSLGDHGSLECGMMFVAESSCNSSMRSQAGQVPSLVTDSGREARVLRYKEKRRTRLFSKKIRYEVRKLNAERRPRMKGRFVKRAAIAAM